MPYTASIQIVPAHFEYMRVPKPITISGCAISPGDRLTLDDLAVWVDVPILPWTCASGMEGYAGWALVGTTLHGFVREGDLAEMVKHDMTQVLDGMRAALESMPGGLEYVREMEELHRRAGQSRVTEIGLEMLRALALLP